MDGAVLSTSKVVLGPAAPARLPALSTPVPEAMEMPRVPVPVMLESATVRVLPDPVTPMLPTLALPVEFTVILPAVSVEEEKWASV